MKPFVLYVVVIAIVAVTGLVTGLFGSALSLTLLSLLGVPIQLLRRAGFNVGIGPQSGPPIIFWLNVLAFAAPAYGLYRARLRLGRAYLLALSFWAIVYLGLMISSGPMREGP
jgi:hypothetical protein